MRYLKAIASLAVAGVVTACAGYHTVPPSNYSATSDGIERIAFDQAGDPYPQSNTPGRLDVPPQPSNHNAAFTLRTYYQVRNVPYDRGILLDQAAARIVEGLHAGKTRRVVFLIKGFNNSYESFDTQYAWMREQVIATRDPERVFFVQVYWDALFKGQNTLPAPLAYFADSLTYSNHAGDCGLRDLLRRLPAGTDVTFLTHSRGAAVALAALSDPKYDRGISNACRSTTPSHALPEQLGDVRLVAFAPAIGDGHMRVSRDVARTDIFARLDRMYAGYNPNDPAVTKKHFGINVPDRLGGDTRLGGNEIYLHHLDELFANAGFQASFQYERFERKSHDWDQYIAMTTQADCLLWAGMILANPPKGCSVTR